MPASVCCTRKDHRLHPRGKRRGLPTANFIFRGPRRRTAHSRLCCDLSCLRTRYPRRHRRPYRQTGMLQALITLLAFMTPRGHIPPLTTILHHSPRHSRPRHLTRTYSLTCRRVTTQILPAIQRHPGHPKAGMDQISTQGLRFIAYHQSASVVNRCCSAPGGSQEPFPKCPIRYSTPPNWQTIST